MASPALTKASESDALLAHLGSTTRLLPVATETPASLFALGGYAEAWRSGLPEGAPLPPSGGTLAELMKDLHEPGVYYGKEHAFLSYVVLPLWTVVEQWLHPHVDTFTENLRRNIEAYRQLKEEHQHNNNCLTN